MGNEIISGMLFWVICGIIPRITGKECDDAGVTVGQQALTGDPTGATVGHQAFEIGTIGVTVGSRRWSELVPSEVCWNPDPIIGGVRDGIGSRGAKMESEPTIGVVIGRGTSAMSVNA